MKNWATCRFCRKLEPDPDKLVKYSTRHYAHFKCYLARGKRLERLPAHQVERFPWFLLKERDLLEIALAIVHGPRGERLWATHLAQLEKATDKLKKDSP